MEADLKLVAAQAEKIEAEKKLAAAPDLISTVRGAGYRFNSAPAVRVRLTRAPTPAGREASAAMAGKTAFVLAGEHAGSKLTKARTLGISVISEEDFFNQLGN